MPGFTEEEMEMMVFDDEMLGIENADGDEELLETPPGVDRPPGLTKRAPGQSIHCHPF